MTDTFSTSADYAAWLAEIKTRIQAARISAAWAVNRDLILLYWDIGREIAEKQYALDWEMRLSISLPRICVNPSHRFVVSPSRTCGG